MFLAEVIIELIGPSLKQWRQKVSEQKLWSTYGHLEAGHLIDVGLTLRRLNETGRFKVPVEIDDTLGYPTTGLLIVDNGIRLPSTTAQNRKLLHHAEALWLFCWLKNQAGKSSDSPFLDALTGQLCTTTLVLLVVVLGGVFWPPPIPEVVSKLTVWAILTFIVVGLLFLTCEILSRIKTLAYRLNRLIGVFKLLSDAQKLLRQINLFTPDERQTLQKILWSRQQLLD